MCGEAAGDPHLALVLAGAGCTSLSMAPGAVAEVRAALSTVTLERCGELTELALAAPDGRTGRATIADALA